MKNIVVIGGGTGSYTVLRGLKNYTKNITAIVSVADSGGSSGILRDEFGILPPGDLRKCLIALSEDSGMLRQLFDYKFEGNSEKHSLGNLIITALEKITGNTALALKEASRLLNVTGKVLPVSLDKSHLYALLENGMTIEGETNIDIPKHDPNLKISKIWLNPRAFIYRETYEAIQNADIIVIGPGDLYSSILPNLAVEGMVESIKKSAAKKVYVCNIMTKHGETNNFKASDFVSEVEKYLKTKLDCILLNNEEPDKERIAAYSTENSILVKPDIDGECVIKQDFLSETTLLRHDSNKIARAIIELIH